MKHRIAFMIIFVACVLIFSSCTPSWIDKTTSKATLHVTETRDVVHHWYGNSRYVAYTMSNGISDNSDNPSYSDFLLSLNDKEVVYKIGYNRDGGYYLRLYRGEIYMDFGIDSRLERGPKKEE